MPKFTDIHELPYSSEELAYFETEMRKFKLPWITKVFKKIGVPFIRFTFLPALIIIIIFGAIYMNSRYGYNDWAWVTAKSIGLFYIFGFGLFALIAHVAELISTNKLRRRLGLTKRDFQILVIAFQITGM